MGAASKCPSAKSSIFKDASRRKGLTTAESPHTPLSKRFFSTAKYRNIVASLAGEDYHCSEEPLRTNRVPNLVCAVGELLKF
jgi:hypothetical protein